MLELVESGAQRGINTVAVICCDAYDFWHAIYREID